MPSDVVSPQASPSRRPDARLFALVPAAGIGERAAVGGPKQYHPVAGVPLVARTLAALAAVPRLEAVMVVLAPGDALFEDRVPGFAGWITRTGGATRAASVAAGLAALRERGATDADWVLVHDAARCLLNPQAVDRLIDACLHDSVGGLLALPVADTLKAESDTAPGQAARTVDRRGLWAAQTPQMFRLGLLAEALERAGTAVTDEASAIEALGRSPRLVRGAPDNLKVTWPTDFAWAERLLRQDATVPDAGVGGRVDPQVLAELHRLEHALLQSRPPVEVDWSQHLAPDFVEVSTDGRLHDRAAALAWLGQSGRPHYLMHGYTAQALGPGLVQVRYEAHRMAVELPLSRSLRTSLWRHTAGVWQMFFAQGTRIAGETPH